MLKLNEIYEGDCLEIMKEIPDKSVDMILCDLPYGTTACKWDTIIPFEPLWAEYKRIIKDNGAIVLTAVEPFSSVLVASNIKNLKESLVWEKHKPSNFANAKRQHMKYHEDIKVFSYGNNLYNPQMQPRESPRMKQMQALNYEFKRQSASEVSSSTKWNNSASQYDANFKLPSTVLKMPTVANNSKEKTPHPTQKPVALFEYLIKTYTNEGETVLDNCIGSGTTAIAAINTNRNFIGIETDAGYCDIARKRISEAKGALV